MAVSAYRRVGSKITLRAAREMAINNSNSEAFAQFDLLVFVPLPNAHTKSIIIPIIGINVISNVTSQFPTVVGVLDLFSSITYPPVFYIINYDRDGSKV
jgi:hypothetical protein